MKNETARLWSIYLIKFLLQFLQFSHQTLVAFNGRFFFVLRMLRERERKKRYSREGECGVSHVLVDAMLNITTSFGRAISEV